MCTFSVVFMEARHADWQAPGTLPGAVADLRAHLLTLDLDIADSDRVTTLRELADLTNTISAVQAKLICDLDASQRAADDLADIPQDRRRGVVGGVGRGRLLVGGRRLGGVLRLVTAAQRTLLLPCRRSADR